MTIEGKTKIFALVVPLGFEKLAEKELLYWLDQLESETPVITIEDGLLEFELGTDKGLSLNFLLKIPTRILMRLKSFRAKDFPRLFQRLKNMEWHQFADSNLEWRIATRASRLAIKKRILETCESATKEFINTSKPEEETQKAYLRIFEDTCSVSIDTSGGLPLYKRGLRKLTSEAPIRENLASGLYQFFKEEIGRANKQTQALYDPFMGSGAMLLEAAVFRKPLAERPFSFEKWKGNRLFKQAKFSRVKHLGEDCEWPNLWGGDLNLKAVEASRINLESLSPQVEVNLEQRDFFHSDPITDGGLPYYVFTNPPYNERIKLDEKANFFNLTLNRLSSDPNCRGAGMIVPSKFLPSLQVPNDWKKVASLKFKNGGIPVCFLVYQPLA